MQALILAGGSGTRFWPLSRRLSPKQLLALGGSVSLLQTTVRRLRPLLGPESIWVCTTEDLVDQVRRQLPQVPPQQILAEPMGRNTAAAIGWAVSSMPEPLRVGLIAVLPADHFVADAEAFCAALHSAASIAQREERIMTLGVVPTRPESGYGYLQLGEELDESTGLRVVKRFIEKPSPERAEEFVGGGSYLWNAGIFVFRGSLLLSHLKTCQPLIAQALEEIARQPDRLHEIYGTIPSISIDHGVMEKLDELGTLPLECGWSDLGSWEALWEQLQKDDQGNALQGSVLAIDSRNNLLYAQDGSLAVVGVEGLVVVQTGDAVLVIPKDRSQEVRRIVAELEASGDDTLL